MCAAIALVNLASSTSQVTVRPSGSFVILGRDCTSSAIYNVYIHIFIYTNTALPIDCIAIALVNLASSTSQVTVRPSGSSVILGRDCTSSA